MLRQALVIFLEVEKVTPYGLDIVFRGCFEGHHEDQILTCDILQQRL